MIIRQLVLLKHAYFPKKKTPISWVAGCWILLLFILASGTLFLPGQTSYAEGETIPVAITGSAQPPGFSPAFVTVHLYDTVVFVNQSVPAASYALTSDDGSFASPIIAHGSQWSVTLNTLGPHAYRIAGSSAAIGELFVVANTVPLLPTPVPAVQGIVSAAVMAGKNPPDTVILPTPTPQTRIKQSQNILPFTPFTTVIVLTVVILDSLLTLTLAFILLIRGLRRRKVVQENEQIQNGNVQQTIEREHVVKQKRRFAWIRTRHNDEDDLDDEEQ